MNNLVKRPIQLLRHKPDDMTSKWSNISIKDMGVAVERVWRRIRSLKTRIQFIKGSSDDILRYCPNSHWMFVILPFTLGVYNHFIVCIYNKPS